MKERIKEFIRLADIHILPDSSEYGHTIIGTEKFAELIIRECAEVVKDFYQETEFSCYSAETEIKDHFGVE